MTWIEVTDTDGRNRVINTKSIFHIKQVLGSDSAAERYEGVQAYIEMKIEFRSFYSMTSTTDIIEQIRGARS